MKKQNMKEVLEALNAHNIPLVLQLIEKQEKRKTKLIDLHWNGRKVEKKTCQMCGKEFETQKKNQVYCSQKCQQKARQIRIKEAAKEENTDNKLPTAKCKMCGRVFAQRNKNHIFCSKKCVDEWHGKPLLQKRFSSPEDMKGECERCSRPAVPGMNLCEHHLELQQRLHG